MNRKILKTISVLIILSFTTKTYAKAESVAIISPSDGATLIASNKNTINFNVTPGSKGDHVHIYVDGKEAAVIHALKGNYTFEKLEAGNRDICVKEMDKGHNPTGAEKCIKVKVE